MGVSVITSVDVNSGVYGHTVIRKLLAICSAWQQYFTKHVQEEGKEAGVLWFLPRGALVQSAVLRLHVVCPSVCSSVCYVSNVCGSWPHRLKILETMNARTISPTPSLFVGRGWLSTYSQGNMGKFWGD